MFLILDGSVPEFCRVDKARDAAEVLAMHDAVYGED